MQTIYILWWRQLKRYSRSKARMIGAIGQPLLFLLAFGFGFGPIFQKAGAGNYIQFLAPGVIAMGIMFTSVFSGIDVIMDRQFGFLKETLVAPVSRGSIMIGRTLGGATVALIQGLIVFVITLLVGFKISLGPELLLAFLFMFFIALVFTAFGTALGSLLDDMQAFPLIINFLVMPLFFLSGALFPLSGLPDSFSIIAKLNPMSYGVDGLRGAFGGLYHFGLSVDVLVLILISAALLGLGSYLFYKIEV